MNKIKMLSEKEFNKTMNNIEDMTGDWNNKEKNIKQRLEYLRGEIKAERISYGEIAELQSLSKHIDKGDVLLLEWAGIKEKV